MNTYRYGNFTKIIKKGGDPILLPTIPENESVNHGHQIKRLRRISACKALSDMREASNTKNNVNLFK